MYLYLIKQLTPESLRLKGQGGSCNYSNRKTKVAKEALSQCSQESHKRLQGWFFEVHCKLFQWKSDITSIKRRMGNYLTIIGGG